MFNEDSLGSVDLLVACLILSSPTVREGSVLRRLGFKIRPIIERLPVCSFAAGSFFDRIDALVG